MKIFTIKKECSLVLIIFKEFCNGFLTDPQLEINIIFDFEGSNLPGVARLYKGFGSKENVYLQIRKNNLPKLVRWLKR